MKEIRQGNTFVEDCGLHEEGPMIENCALPSADGARVWELIARAGTLDWAEAQQQLSTRGGDQKF